MIAVATIVVATIGTTANAQLFQMDYFISGNSDNVSVDDAIITKGRIVWDSQQNQNGPWEYLLWESIPDDSFYTFYEPDQRTTLEYQYSVLPGGPFIRNGEIIIPEYNFIDDCCGRLEFRGFIDTSDLGINANLIIYLNGIDTSAGLPTTAAGYFDPQPDVRISQEYRPPYAEF